MLIDFHTHVYPDKIAERTVELLLKNSDGVAYSDGRIDGLLKQMEKADADLCVNLPVLTKPSQFDSVIRFAGELNERFKDAKRRIISFAGIHPDCENINEKMKYIKDSGFLGVKIHPDYQGHFIDSDGYREILYSAKDNDLIVITHAGIDDGFRGEPVKCPPELSRKVLKDLNYEKIVWGHFGGLKQWEDVEKYLCDLNIYFDTAFTLSLIEKEQFKRILNSHGEDRVLFATDSPWRDIEEDKNIFLSYGLNKETNEKIMYKNAKKLLGIK